MATTCTAANFTAEKHLHAMVSCRAPIFQPPDEGVLHSLQVLLPKIFQLLQQDACQQAALFPISCLRENR